MQILKKKKNAVPSLLLSSAHGPQSPPPCIYKDFSVLYPFCLRLSPTSCLGANGGTSSPSPRAQGTAVGGESPPLSGQRARQLCSVHLWQARGQGHAGITAASCLDIGRATPTVTGLSCKRAWQDIKGLIFKIRLM